MKKTSKGIKRALLLIKKEVILCLAVPIITAVLTMLSFNNGTEGVVSLIQEYTPMITVGLLCVFTYGLVRIFMVLKKKEALVMKPGDSGSEEFILSEKTLYKSKSIKYRFVILVIAVLLPIAGLTLNNSDFFFGAQTIGDFSNVWFYLIALVNGLIMLIDIKGNTFSLVLFSLKSMGFIYIVYFTLVFMPLMPLGVIALIAYGMGILMFVPMAIFIIQTFQMLQDIRRLKTRFKISSILAAAFLGIAILPTALAINFTLDKGNFDRAGTYLSAESVLSADAAKLPAVNITRLERTLKQINYALETSQGNRWGEMLFVNGSGTPMISKMYQMMVLEDAMISQETTQRLIHIFLGIPPQTLVEESFGNPGQKVSGFSTQVSTTTEFDEEIGVYKTWVDLEIQEKENNASSIRGQGEYVTEFSLPDGCFIKDYYLYVGSERKRGILADKRAAETTYTQIVRSQQDPGLIRYIGDSTLELRVFPFAAQEVRQTGFLVWHSQSEVVTIDGQDILLTAQNTADTPIAMEGVSFIPAGFKKDLPVYERSPKYYFVLDAGTDSPFDEHLKTARAYIQRYGITDARIYAASYQVCDTEKGDVEHRGGFNLPLAMERVFRDVEQSEFPCFPIIIAVSDNIYRSPAFLRNTLAKAFPESAYYYNLEYDLSLTPYSFSENKRLESVQSPILSKALRYNDVLVANNNKSETVLGENLGEYTGHDYQDAFILFGKTSLNANNKERQAELVRDSFRQRMLTPYTAFTVLETQAQEKDLLELQDKFLNGGEEAPVVKMNEPGLIICLLMAALAFVVFSWKDRKGYLRY